MSPTYLCLRLLRAVTSHDLGVVRAVKEHLMEEVYNGVNHVKAVYLINCRLDDYIKI